MTDAKTKAAGADESAPDAEKTDEQLWDELGSQETDSTPDADAADADAAKDNADNADAADGADDVVDPDPDETDDPGTSDDDSDGADDDDAPDGMDREVLQAQNERLQHTAKSDQGRLAYGEREIKRLNRLIVSAPDPKAQSDDPDDASLKERREKLDASREEYGDVIGPLADEITAIRREAKERRDEDVAQKAKELDDLKARYDELVATEVKVFKAEHKDGFETIAKHREVFDEWIDDQPRALRDIYAANHLDIVNGTQAAILVTRFKQALLGDPDGSAPANPETERLQSRRQRQLAGARSLRSSTGQTASSRPAKDSTDDEGHWDYWKRRDQRDKS